MTDALPPRVQTVLGASAGPAPDRELHAELLFEPETAQWLRAYAPPYRLAGAPTSRLLSAPVCYRIGGDAPGVRTPLLIVDSGPDTPWPNQSRKLGERVGSGGSLIDAPPAEREARASGWLEEILGG
jgi:hypothetical protein